MITHKRTGAGNEQQQQKKVGEKGSESDEEIRQITPRTQIYIGI